MSIKMFVAYKIPYPDKHMGYLYEFIDLFDTWACRDLMQRLKPCMDKYIEEYEKSGKKPKYIPELRMMATIEAASRFKQGTILYNVERSFDWFTYDDIIVISAPNMELRLSEWPEWVQDFHYQDQVDRDDNIPDDEWQYRSKVWNDVFYGDFSKKGAVFTHPVISALGQNFSKPRSRLMDVLWWLAHPEMKPEYI